jgi:hypothetical protein
VENKEKQDEEDSSALTRKSSEGIVFSEKIFHLKKMSCHQILAKVTALPSSEILRHHIYFSNLVAENFRRTSLLAINPDERP